MLSVLGWIGARARWMLVLGLLAAMLIPGPGALLAGTLPIWVGLLYGLAMMRIDLGTVARRALGPRRMLRNLGLLALLMGGTPVLGWALATAVGAAPAHIEALVYTMSAPPLGSATAFCLILGLDAALALELTVLGSFLAPLTMPLVSRLLLGEALAVDALEMLSRLALLIGIASLAAVLVRRLLGADRITARAQAFDGLSALILVMFLFPLFDGMLSLMGTIPAFAVATLALAILANLGVQVASFLVLRPFSGREAGGALSLIWGNRNAALTLAFLPEAPLILLYIGLYQFPMYVTPLVMRWVLGGPPAASSRGP